MNRSQLRVSIVIPAYNEEIHLRRCLQAIALQTIRPYEVIVVNNDSTDRTAAVAASYPFVTVVNEARRGRVHARNAGFDRATGDIIGRIDADIVLPANWVEHVQRFYSHPGSDGQAWSGAGYFYNVRLPRLVSFGYGILAFRLNKLLVGHFTLWGSNMAFTRKQWQAVRRMACADLDIHEDLDLAIHLHRAGYGITYDTGIKTRAELRRVNSERHELWGYLQWWPRTLRRHGHHSWWICWFFGAFLLYLASFFWVLAEAVSVSGKSSVPVGDADARA